MCAQRRLKSVCASAQDGQRLRCPHEDTLDLWLPMKCLAKTLIRLRGCTGWYESLLPHKCNLVGNAVLRLICKTHLYSFDPLKPRFYTIKLGFTGVYINFLFLLKNVVCGYSLEPPRRGDSNKYTLSIFEQKYETTRIFHLKVFIFWWYNSQYIWIGMFS